MIILKLHDMELKKYLINFFNKKKLNKSISCLAFWDRSTRIDDRVYLGATARLMNCTIGKYTRIKPGCVFKNVDMGNYCSIANDVMIGLGQHPTCYISTNSIFYKPGIRDDFARKIDFEEEKRTTVGNDVWIGNGAVVMDGVTIGNGAIIASRAVVTKNIPAYAIVGGVPAKVLKYRFTDDVVAALQESNWWNLGDDEIMTVLGIFTDKDITAGKVRDAFQSVRS